jgi:hypothetical protein
LSIATPALVDDVDASRFAAWSRALRRHTPRTPIEEH